jgi:hypothetical protein
MKEKPRHADRPIAHYKCWLRAAKNFNKSWSKKFNEEPKGA